MADLQITDGFKEDLIAVESDKLLNHILDIVDLLQTIPTMGSGDLPASIRHAYGDNARKIPVGPFDVITYYDEPADTVIVAGLVHQRAAW